jgi:o-succinylbenzoate synthase
VSRLATRLVRKELSFRQPLRTARGEFATRTSLLVELRDAQELRGFGEAAPWVGFGTDLDATQRALRAALGRLEGVRDAAEDGSVPAVVDRELRGYLAARAAVEGALCDLAARRAGLPLAAWLAARTGNGVGAPLERVACSALLHGRTPDAVRQEAMRARAAGSGAVKLKLGGVPLADDVARVRAARAGLGPGVRLRGDANGAWSLSEAEQALRMLAPFELEYVEQPLAREDLTGLADLRLHAPVRIAADESVADEQGLHALIERRAADHVVLKPALLGGPLCALDLAAQARAAGLGVVFTHACESAVGAWQAAHCAAAWANPHAVHGLHTAGLFVDDLGTPVEAVDGFVTIPRHAGLGFEPWA